MKKASYTNLSKKMFNILEVERIIQEQGYDIVSIHEARNLINLLAVSELGIGTTRHDQDYNIVKLNGDVSAVSDIDVLLSFYESRSIIISRIKEKFPEIVDILKINGIIRK